MITFWLTFAAGFTVSFVTSMWARRRRENRARQGKIARIGSGPQQPGGDGSLLDWWLYFYRLERHLAPQKSRLECLQHSVETVQLISKVKKKV